MLDSNDLKLQGGVVNPSDGPTLTDNATSPKWTITLAANGVLSAAGTAATNCV
jgi:hypothetical protein